MSAPQVTTSRSSLMAVTLVAVAALLGCTDYGYDAPPYTEPVPDGSDDDAGDGDGDCVEGVVSPRATGPQVRYAGFTAIPASLTIGAGDVVTWTNEDAVVHTVTAGTPDAELPPSEGGFDSGDIAGGASWAYRFCEARTAVYFCRPHKTMMFGYEVVVQ